MTHHSQLQKTKYGYFTLKKKPTKLELQSYYQDLYFQNDLSTYRKKYSSNELLNIQYKIQLKHKVISSLNNAANSILDIGCGEGWTIMYFHKLGWRVKGIDESLIGCSQHNPAIVSSILRGSIDDTEIQKVISKEKYDVIWLDNILEHVLEPRKLVKLCIQLMNSKSILMVEVPNDNSELQQYLYKNNFIKRKHWVKYPDHINYFNKSSLNKFLRNMGLAEKLVVADWPVEINLFNNLTNYVNNPKIGSSCHSAKIALENYIYSHSIENTILLNKSFADLGIGRQIVGFYKLE